MLTPRATLVGRTTTGAYVALDGRRAVFACGDAVRGQSLIVWAIAEGRSAAAAIDALPHGAPERASGAGRALRAVLVSRRAGGFCSIEPTVFEGRP